MLLSKLKTFAGGLHIKDYKSLAKDKHIENMPLPAKVRIPVSQHFGKPALPIVKVSDMVYTGQLIAESQGDFSANIHASISGKITAIDKFPHPTGGELLAIEIENDGTDTFKSDILVDDPIDIIKEAGIVGMGGAMFPTHIKLNPPQDKKIEALIVNGVECEPYITSDYRVMIEAPDQILKGLSILMKITGIEKAYIGIEANKPDAIELFRSKISGNPNIKVVPLKTKYPQGGEKQLIKAILNKEIPSGKLPFDVGAVVLNIFTVFAIYEAIELKKPLYERVVTVTGSCVKNTANLKVRIGTSFRDVLEYCGLSSIPSKVIMGGPMMGLAQYTMDVPVIKGTNGILAMSSKETLVKPAEVCLRCGKCVVKCPMGLDPGTLATLIEKSRIEEAIAKGAKDCVECGLCAYLCPSNRNIVQLIKYAKQKR